MYHQLYSLRKNLTRRERTIHQVSAKGIIKEGPWNARICHFFQSKPLSPCFSVILCVPLRFALEMLGGEGLQQRGPGHHTRRSLPSFFLLFCCLLLWGW